MGTREKVKSEYITEDDDKRKVSFKKREGGFMKKEAKDEPSILGGVHEEVNLMEMDRVRVMEAYGKEEDEVYIPAPPMSEKGLLINNGENDVKLDGQILDHGMNF
ncbi:uncharacterized protein G2W53_025837 [Senna tora]|uniref:Uncharacterized protein n=1 Tax=Senna tora TaxID=362788 RepID=A0A834TFT7_9FABA|nr:uncharacterized protein G2W53_025837 [Senna tora]